VKAFYPSRRPDGFALLELVIVLAVIVVMLAILIPGIRRAQEMAHRTNCGNNLKQIALALNNYHDVHDVFPPGYVSRSVTPASPASEETGPGFAWGALLLPFLDQQPLYQTIDFSTAPGLVGGGTAISVYQCPSNFPAPPSSYVGSAGFGNLTQRPGAPPSPGILYRNSSVPVFDIRDGTSNTFLLGERAGVHDFVPGEPPVTAGGEWLSTPPGLLRPAGLSDARIDEGSASLVLGTVGQDEPEAVHVPPLHSNHVAGFSSPHGEGVHAAMADGSVHFISLSIDYPIYRALGGRRDGELGTVSPRF
jgi:prepilin-type N-terminal cleavage/methylation domain-containing protein/prepilin-type processing-associated H-X9-DG protein